MLLALDAQLTASPSGLAVLMVDLSDVSRIQARLGFAESATLLQTVFDAFSAALGDRSRLIRLADGRFCAIVTAVRNSGHAVLAGEKLSRTADELWVNAGIAIKPGLNIGIALYPSQATEPEPLLRLAQLAAEASGKRATRVVVFDELCRTQVVSPWALSNDFAQALDGGELAVYFQPKVAMSTGRPVAVEALMRWFRDGKIVATPDVFIPVAAEAGLMHALTWYSLSNSLRMSRQLAGLSVAVNIAPETLHHREFMEMIRTAVKTWEVKEHGLTLEVTEGALITDFDQATLRLTKLRDMGIRVSIDDFGTGYSSLSYFKKIPADELKIDKSFVKGMTTDPADKRLVQTIIGLAHHFKLEVVAEGVEDRATFDALAQMGCQQAQGYLFSPALSLERLREWLQTHEYDLRQDGKVDAPHM